MQQRKTNSLNVLEKLNLKISFENSTLFDNRVKRKFCFHKYCGSFWDLKSTVSNANSKKRYLSVIVTVPLLKMRMLRDAVNAKTSTFLEKFQIIST